MTKYISAAQLAERYAVSERTVWRWARQGALPTPHRLSDACTRWRLDEIERRDREREAGRAA